MMNYHRTAIVFIVSLLVSACGTLPFQKEDESRLEQLNRYSAEGEYARAHKLIASTTAEHPEYKKIKAVQKQLQAKIRRHEQQVITSALKQERNNDWEGALDSYHGALTKLPDSLPLQQGLGATEERRLARVAALKLENLIVRGEWLIRELPLRRSLRLADPGSLIAQWNLSRMQNDAESVAADLRQSGLKALNQGKFAIAHRTLPLAAELDPSKENTEARQKLEKMLKSRKEIRQQRKALQVKKKHSTQIDSFNASLAQGNLLQARDYLNLLSAQKPQPDDLALMEEQLAQAINTHVEQELQVGDTFYRSGEFEQAIKTWEDIIALVPDHEDALNKLDRAHKVQKNLEEIKQRQAGNE